MLWLSLRTTLSAIGIDGNHDLVDDDDGDGNGAVFDDVGEEWH